MSPRSSMAVRMMMSIMPSGSTRTDWATMMTLIRLMESVKRARKWMQVKGLISTGLLKDLIRRADSRATWSLKTICSIAQQVIPWRKEVMQMGL